MSATQESIQLNQDEMERRYNLRQAHIDSNSVLSAVQESIEFSGHDRREINLKLNELIRVHHGVVVPVFVEEEVSSAVQTLSVGEAMHSARSNVFDYGRAAVEAA